MSTFLHVHPCGASVDYIQSYLTQLHLSCRTFEISEVLEQHSSLFKLHTIGVGASLEKRWKFVGFDPNSL